MLAAPKTWTPLAIARTTRTVLAVALTLRQRARIPVLEVRDPEPLQSFIDAPAGFLAAQIERQAYFWATHAGAELDLVVLRGSSHDAPLSVRRAYRADEMADLLRTAGLEPVRTFRGAVGQRYAIAARASTVAIA